MTGLYFLLLLLPAVESEIKSDEVVVFYPSYAVEGRDTATKGVSWKFAVHGSIFEPESNSLKRRALVASLRESLQLTEGTPQAAIFDQRIRPFLVDHERGKSIFVRLLGEDFLGEPVAAGTSAANGHFRQTLEVTNELATQLTAGTLAANRWIEYQAITPRDDPRRFVGRVQLLPPHGVSVVSDIDDTIKISQVTDKSQVLANTFVRPFRRVPGMADLYAQAAAGGAAFHYVSGSPWQLCEPLAVFLQESGFPVGSMHLKLFRLTDSSALHLLASQQEHKLTNIRRILADFPQRKFLLVGDSGEQDPEIYGELARTHPNQILGIFIRDVTNQPADAPRYQAAFAEIPAARWTVFVEAAEIRESFLALAKPQPGHLPAAAE